MFTLNFFFADQHIKKNLLEEVAKLKESKNKLQKDQESVDVLKVKLADLEKENERLQKEILSKKVEMDPIRLSEVKVRNTIEQADLQVGVEYLLYHEGVEYLLYPERVEYLLYHERVTFVRDIFWLK